MRLIIFLFSIICVFAQERYETGKVLPVATKRVGNQVIDDDGLIKAEFRLRRKVIGKTPVERARNYFREESAKYKMTYAQADALKHVVTQRSKAATHVRLQQTYQNIPVYGGEIVVSLNDQDEITMVVNEQKQRIYLQNLNPSLTSSAAIQQAARFLEIKADERPTGETRAELMVFDNGKQDKLIYKVIYAVINKRLQGDYEILVDAHSGEIIRSRNQIKRYRPDSHTHSDNHPQDTQPKKATSTGYVYLTDPLSALGRTYGTTGLTDNGDQTSPQLDSARSLVTLNHLTEVNGKFSLENEYVTFFDNNNNNDTIPLLADSDGFRFDRSQKEFEAVMVHYHISHIRHTLKALGFDINPNNLQSTAVRVDPHGTNDDNSFFSPSQDLLVWGDGGVDDAEDADVIWHEFGHALQDFIVAGFQGNDGLGEGFSDYWAQTWSRDQMQWNSNDNEYHWVYNWDGHNPFWGGRTTITSKKYPADLTGNIYEDGQIWAHALMQIREQAGSEVTDVIVVQSHYYLAANATQAENAEAILQASTDLYDGAYNDIILSVFQDVGQLANYNIVQAPTNLQAISLNGSVQLSWQSPPIKPDSYIIFRSTDNQNFNVIANSITSETFTDASVQNETDYWYKVKAVFDVNESDFSNSASARPTNLSGPRYLVIRQNPNPASADSIVSAIRSNGRRATLTLNYPDPDSLANYDGVFLTLGIYDDNVLLTESTFNSVFKPYLDAGGRLYIEGGDVWAYDPDNGGAQTVLTYFGIDGIGDGVVNGISGNITGTLNNFTDSMSFSYNGDNSFIDRLQVQGFGQGVFTADGYIRVIRNAVIYRTIGSALEFGGFASSGGLSTQTELMRRYLDYFEFSGSGPLALIDLDSIQLQVIGPDTNSFEFTIQNVGSDTLIYTVSGPIAKSIGVSFNRTAGRIGTGDTDTIVGYVIGAGNVILENLISIETNDLNALTNEIPLRVNSFVDSTSIITVGLPMDTINEDGVGQLNLRDYFIVTDENRSLQTFAFERYSGPLDTVQFNGSMMSFMPLADSSGTAIIYVSTGIDGSDVNINDSLLVTIIPVDDPPDAADFNGSFSFRQTETDTLTLAVTGLFSDRDSSIDSMVVLNSNTSVFTASLSDSLLHLIPASMPAQGFYQLTLRGYSNGLFAEVLIPVTVIDGIAPDGRLSLSAPFEPGLENRVRFFVQFNEALSGDRLESISVNDADLTPLVIDAEVNLFAADYLIPQSGNLNVFVQARDTALNQADTTFTVAASISGRNQPDTLFVANRVFTIPDQFRRTPILIYDQDMHTDDQAFGNAFQIVSEELRQPIQVTLEPIPQASFNRSGLYRFSGSEWEFVSYVEGSFGQPAVAIDRAGIYRIAFDESQAPKPTEFVLEQNYPNPFNPTTRIRFSLPNTENVSLIIYNMLGQKVQTLVRQRLTANRYDYVWNGLNDDGNALPSGMYIYRLTAGSRQFIKKMVMIR